MVNIVEESETSELARSMRDVAGIWRQHNQIVQPPFGDSSQAALDLEKEPELCPTGVRSLTNLTLSCNLSMVHASDQISGVAACTESPDVGWAMYSCARTALVASARAHYLSSGRNPTERLRRHLNDELGANSSIKSMAFHSHEDLLEACQRTEEKIKRDGAAAGLIWREDKFEPYFAVSKNQKRAAAAPSETKKIKLLLAEEKGMNEQMKAFSYRLLSTIVHDRTRSAGLMRQVKVGEPQHGIQETEMYTTPKIMARGTAMVVRAFEIAGMSTLEHCGGDPEAFKSDVRNASQRWIEIAEVAG